MSKCAHSWKHLAGNSARELYWCQICGTLRLSAHELKSLPLRLEVEESGEFFLAPYNIDPSSKTFAPSINAPRK